MLTVRPLACTTLPPTLKADWDRLWSLSATPSFQSEFEWIRAWTEHLRAIWTPLLLLAEDRGRLQGILPLMYRDDRRRGLVPYRRLRFLASDASDFSTVLAAPADVGAVVRAALGWLVSGALRWEELVLDDLPEDNPAVAAIEAFFAGRGESIDLHQGRYYYIDLARPWEEIWKATSKHYVRSNLNTARNRLNRAGEWRVAADPAWTEDRLVETAAVIHVLRQTSLDRPSRYEEPAYKQFLRRVIGHNRAQGRFRSHWLLLGDRPIAFLFGFEQERGYYFWTVAFDPEGARFYPTRVLLAHVIRECHDRRLKEFNMMRGEAEYKAKWTQESRGNIRFRIMRRDHLYGRFVSLLEKAV